jgi:hypothetical protein
MPEMWDPIQVDCGGFQKGQEGCVGSIGVQPPCFAVGEDDRGFPLSGNGQSMW